MMKKVIAFTLFSLLGFGGFVVGFPGIGLAQPPEEKEKNCTVKTHPQGKTKIKKIHKDFGKDVLAVLVLKADGNIEVLEGPGQINFREPRDVKEGKPGRDVDEQPPASYPSTDILPGLEGELHGTFKRVDITTFVGNSCMNVNGRIYCW